MRIGLAIVVAVLACAAGAASAVADDSTLQADARIGAFRTKAAPLLAEAIRVFGTPSAQKRVADIQCRAVWKARGLAMAFLDLGQTGKPCANGGFVRATMTGRAWHTASGLHVGDGAARLRQLFPRATLVRGAGEDSGWWLVTRHACKEVGGQAFPGLLARMIDGRVAAFVLRLGVCE